MRPGNIVACIVLALAAAVGAAVTAPAEVVDNLDFFADLELLSNLEILEENQPAYDVEASSAAAAEIAASTAAVRVSTFSREGL